MTKINKNQEEETTRSLDIINTNKQQKQTKKFKSNLHFLN